MTKIRMCDLATRIWCCRILLVFTVLGVLSTMIYQIWSYYFYLVRQMDEQTIQNPQVMGFVELCSDVKFVWNIDCSKNAEEYNCRVKNVMDNAQYVSLIGQANVTIFDEYFLVDSIVDCASITVWAIPW